MLEQGPARKVSIYVGEEQQYHGQSAYSAILDFLFYRRISGAMLTRGIAGFGADRHLHASRLVDLATNLPIKIEFVEAPATVDALLPKLTEMAGTGLIEVQETTVIKPSSPASETEELSKPLKIEGKAKLMRIFFGENDRWRGKPLHEALVEALRANEIAGVTVYRGILGYGANRRIHSESALGLSHDRPVMLTVIDAEEKLRNLTPILNDMIQQGLVVISDVDIIKYTHDYRRRERRQEERT